MKLDVTSERLFQKLFVSTVSYFFHLIPSLNVFTTTLYTFVPKTPTFSFKMELDPPMTNVALEELGSPFLFNIVRIACVYMEGVWSF